MTSYPYKAHSTGSRLHYTNPIDGTDLIEQTGLHIDPTLRQVLLNLRPRGLPCLQLQQEIQVLGFPDQRRAHSDSDLYLMFFYNRFPLAELKSSLLVVLGF